jgi:type I protein arginine methyltransferase
MILNRYPPFRDSFPKLKGSSSMQIHKDTRYWVSNEISIHFDSNRHVYFRTPKGELTGDYIGLPILSAFVSPCSIEEAVKKLTPIVSGIEEWKIMTGAIMSLIEAGILVNEENNGQIKAGNESIGGFDFPSLHVKMLNDRERTGAYIAAIRETVRPGDIAVDLGTGTGILAIAAAQAGAAHVYAIESGEIMADIARKNVFQNGLQEKVTVIQGWSTKIELPHKADVLISEIIGNEPLGEHVIRYTTDAFHRWMKPDARLIPSNLRVFALPVEAPADIFETLCFTENLVAEWQKWYGINFNGCLAGKYPPLLRNFIKPDIAQKLRPLALPINLTSFDLKYLNSWRPDFFSLHIQNKGRLDGILVFFELQLGNQTSFNSAPHSITSRTFSWKYPLYIFPSPREVNPGDSFRIKYDPTSVGNYLTVESV